MELAKLTMMMAWTIGYKDGTDAYGAYLDLVKTMVETFDQNDRKEFSMWMLTA
jgi:hypothetical protein